MSAWFYMSRVKKSIKEDRVVLDICIKRCVDRLLMEESSKIIVDRRQV